MFRLETYYLYLVSLILKHEPYRKLIVPQGKFIFRAPSLNFIASLQWYGQKTPCFFFDFREMAFKGLGVIWPKDSLVLTQPCWHQGVF